MSEPLPFPVSGLPEHLSGDPEHGSRLPESRNTGAWSLLNEAAQQMGVGSDAVRKRIAAGTVRARKRGSRWEVWLPSATPAQEAEVDAGGEPLEPSGNPEAPIFRKSGWPEDGSGSQESHSGNPETATMAAVAELGTGLVTLIEKLQEENRQLAGQVGFLQAQRQQLEERIQLLEAPKDEPLPDPEPETLASNSVVTPTWPERRSWWQRLVFG